MMDQELRPKGMWQDVQCARCPARNEEATMLEPSSSFPLCIHCATSIAKAEAPRIALAEWEAYQRRGAGQPKRAIYRGPYRRAVTPGAA